MSQQNTVQAGERKEEVKRAMYILIVWTLAVVTAGIFMVLLADPFAAIFS
ncbi:hypothetical protein [Natrarchaeobaculum aegyptiacum]|nr:hypothetical protein [Natrarchaeobaculum aegyptiacum]